jgi:cellulase
MIAALFAIALAETRPSLIWSQCTKAGCTKVTGSVTVDVSSRGSGSGDVDYAAQLGVTSTGTSLTQKLVTIHNGVKNVGSRLYLLNSAGTAYQMFKFVGKELAYDVDLSELPCGMNGAIYTSEMPATGGTASAALGGGYCDANYVGGNGCAEFDIAEANTRANVFTTHPCNRLGVGTRSTISCQQDGCGFNAYRYGAKQFWGPGSSYTVDTSKPMTVITQFLGTGTLTEIRRLYKQGGKLIQNAKPLVYNTASYDSLTDAFCKTAGHSVTPTTSLAQMGKSFDAGHVLIFSLWDAVDGMGWLDASEYGPCPGGTADSAATIEARSPNLKVVYSNVKFGDIDSTYS